MKQFKILLMAGIGISFALGGCDQYVKSNLNQHRVAVESERYVHEMPLEEVDAGVYKALAYDYKKHGDGGLYLSFVYNPRSRHHTAMSASERAAEASKLIRSTGVRDVKADILPVKNVQGEGKLVVSYTRYTAHAPKDCTPMPGSEGSSVETDWNYRQGCGIETYLAKQIARPKDLLGRGGLPETSSGRRAANVSVFHQAGVPNEPLEGESATNQGGE